MSECKILLSLIFSFFSLFCFCFQTQQKQPPSLKYLFINSRHIPFFVLLQAAQMSQTPAHTSQSAESPKRFPTFPCFISWAFFEIAKNNNQTVDQQWLLVSQGFSIFTIRNREVEQNPFTQFSAKVQSLNPMEVYKRWVWRNREYVHSLESLANVSLLDKPSLFLFSFFCFL